MNLTSSCVLRSMTIQNEVVVKTVKLIIYQLQWQILFLGANSKKPQDGETIPADPSVDDTPVIEYLPIDDKNVILEDPPVDEKLVIYERKAPKKPSTTCRPRYFQLW